MIRRLKAGLGIFADTLIGTAPRPRKQRAASDQGFEVLTGEAHVFHVELNGGEGFRRGD